MAKSLHVDSKHLPIIIISIGIAILVFANLDMASPSPSVDGLPPPPVLTELGISWLDEYSLDLDLEGIEPDYLATTSYYDTQSDLIQQISGSILSTSNSPKEVVEKTLKYVYNQVEYVSGESDAACLQATGSKVIKSGQGQCDTQSISIITLLRSMGIASRPVGGCTHYDVSECAPMQAIFKFKKTPKLEEVEIIEGEDVGRGGYLHAWVEVWLPDKGWVTLEPTTGEFAQGNCYNYLVEMYPDNDDKYHICFAESRDFALRCQRL